MSQASKALSKSFNRRIYTYPAFRADVQQIFDHMVGRIERAAGRGVDARFQVDSSGVQTTTNEYKSEF